MKKQRTMNKFKLKNIFFIFIFALFFISVNISNAETVANVNGTNTNTNETNSAIINKSTGIVDTITNTNLKTDVLDKLPLGTSKGPDTIDKIIEIFLDIVNWIFVVATGIGVLMIIISGISYMLAGGDETRAGKATKTLLYSALGVAISLTSSFVIQIIKNLLIS